MVDAYGERCAAAHRDGRKRDLVSELWRTSGQCSTYLERLSVLSGLLYDAEYISIRNLEITNNPCVKNERLNQADRMNRTGVSVIAKNHGTLHEIELDHLYIHDVEGNIYDKHLNNGGIYMSVSRPDDEEKTGIARYDGIHIHHCKVENCRRWGIAAGYTYQHDKFTTLELPDEVVKTYGSTNVVIEHNFVKDIGGDGITPMYCFEPLIQYNVSENIAVDIHPDLYNEEGNRGGMTAAAIWPWKCKTALFQYNEAYNTVYNQDGQAWDADSGDGTIYQYNYSCNNGGGCVMFCEGESVNNIFRYNISQNDGTGILTPVRNVDAKILWQHLLYKEGVDFIRHRIWGDTMIEGGGIEVTDNIIIYAGNAPRESWTYNSPKAYYQSNTYVNYQNTPEGDPAPILPLRCHRHPDSSGHRPGDHQRQQPHVQRQSGLCRLPPEKRRHRPSETVNFRNKITRRKDTKFFTKKLALPLDEC